jgi:RNA polymerase sigma-70 factor (ECF subfamily)
MSVIEGAGSGHERGRMPSPSELPSPEPAPAARKDTVALDTIALPPTTAAPESVPQSAPHNFSVFVRAEFVWVWRLLRRIGLSPADADDATQQVFLVAARRGGDVAGGSARAFLYGTALRVAANARRSLRRRREVPSAAVAEGPAHELLPDELLEQRRARVLLDALLAQMPPDLRRVLVLAEIEQLTVPQIADLEGVALGTAASRLRRARAVFFGLLEREQQARAARPCP